MRHVCYIDQKKQTFPNSFLKAVNTSEMVSFSDLHIIDEGVLVEVYTIGKKMIILAGMVI